MTGLRYMANLLEQVILLQQFESNDNLIEFVLRHADDIQKCVDIKKLEIQSGGGGHTGGEGSGHSRISDPTALSALRAVEPVPFIHCPFGPAINGRRDERFIRLPEKWLSVEKLTREFYTRDAEKKFVREIYRRRYLQGEFGEKWEITCVKLDIRKAMYYAVVHDIVRFASLYAAGMGLIAPYSRFGEKRE